MARRVAAIHQPNFLPWLGFFDKLARADVFVMLDSVQFPKKGGTWTNRVRMLVNGSPAWITVPVDRSYHGLRAVSEMRIDQAANWRAKTLRTIQSAYGRAQAFEDVSPVLTHAIRNETTELGRFNESAIVELSGLIGFGETEIVRASTLETEGDATDLLVSICRAVSANGYLAGGGAGGYQEDSKFASAGIELIPQRFDHPTYTQPGEMFVPGLSIVDALMNLGFTGTAELFAPRS